MDASRLLKTLESQGDQLVGELFGYHTVGADWSVEASDGLTEHLIYLVVSGECAGEVSGRTIRLSSGAAMWLPSGTGFRLWSTGAPITLYRFRLGEIDPTPPELLIITDAWDLRAPLDALIAELGSELAWRPIRIRALLVVVISTLLRLAERNPGPAPLTMVQRQVIEQWVDDRLRDRPSAADLAEVVQLSPDYFTRRFRQTYGLAPKTWLVRRRMSHAANRLDETNHPVGRIAGDLGYPDGYLFSRQFKQVFGISPRAWRDRSRS